MLTYESGDEIRAGDEIVFANGGRARVVFVVEKKEYTAEYPASRWGFIEDGIGVVHPNQELIVYDEFCRSDDVKLVKRG